MRSVTACRLNTIVFLAVCRPATVRERILFGVSLKKMQKCFAGENRKGLSEEVLKT